MIIGALLALGVGVELACCLGVLLRRSAIDRLHFAGAGTTLGPLLIGAAVLVEESVSSAGVNTILVVALLVVLGPVVTIATARLIRELEP
ncbi:MAG TPA: monovalent cation/H(+) antiporter subunit G [Gaiellaceae bacterium]|nr:monovalent cation/H(+) antiporter subunit G [Gaiellaceae bacterium]